MTCIRCKHDTAYKFGTYGKRKVQRYRCHSCKSTFADTPVKTLGRHYTDIDRASKVLSMMLEGMSIRAISRLTDMDKNTIMALLVSAGEHAQAVFDSRVRGVTAKYVQADEVWGFCHTKDARTRKDDPDEWGHSYLWVALDADTKMILAYHMGKRSSSDAHQFISALANRVHGHFQLTTDGFPAYLKPAEDLLWARSDLRPARQSL
jgi:transposase-like protein/IS1 family transposase